MKKIKIKTKSGEIITRKANVIDFIGDEGRYSVAYVGDTTYYVIDRDFGGAVFGVKK